MKWKWPFDNIYTLEDYPDIEDIEFPDKLMISFAVCSKECGNWGFVVNDSQIICEYCGHRMKTLVSKIYKLKKDTNLEIKRGCI